jgi:hypothetical protein
VDENGIGLVHEQIEWRNLSTLRGFYQTQHPSSKTILVKEENRQCKATASLPTGCTRKNEIGAYGIRTRDLLNAIEALYQLS